MSVFRPQDSDDSVNVTKIHPLKEFTGLILSAAALVLLVYAAVSVAAEWAVRRVSVETENWIWSHLALSETVDEKADGKNRQRRAHAQQVLDRIPASQKPEGYEFRVRVAATKEVNAYALPGGHILLTTGLLDRLQSENELVFVLGHELGHFAHRDHLRGMGMKFAALLIGIAVMGEHGAIGDAISGLSSLTQMAYSRRDEARADQWALATVQATYGHAAGAAAFFNTMDDPGKFSMPALFQTHPLNRDRIEAVEKAIEKNNYGAGPLHPLPWATKMEKTK